LSLALYLGMGWAVLAMIGQLVDRLPGLSLVLLVGAAWSIRWGRDLHAHRLKYHTACWHALVLTAVCLHATAMHAASHPLTGL